MGAHNETCTDTEFIQLWGQLQSATKIGQHLGINTRAVHLRRRWIEKTYNMTLNSKDHRGDFYNKNKPVFNSFVQRFTRFERDLE